MSGAAPAAGRVFQFKLVLLGDSAVGKSSLVLRFVRGQFFEYQESTIGAAFLTQTVALNDTTVKFEIWDTAGQERYHSLAPMYYRGAAAAIVVYDITNRVSACALAAAVCPRRPAASPPRRLFGGRSRGDRRRRGGLCLLLPASARPRPRARCSLLAAARSPPARRSRGAPAAPPPARARQCARPLTRAPRRRPLARRTPSSARSSGSRSCSGRATPTL